MTKEFIVEINGKYLVKRRSGTPRVAAAEALKQHPEFGISYRGGRDRQLRQREVLQIRVMNRADFPGITFPDEER